MDPLSVTASVIAIVQLSQQVFAACSEYVSNFQDAPSDLRSIMIEVGSVKTVMEVARVLMSTRSAEGKSALFEHLGGQAGAFGECQRVLFELRACVPTAERITHGRRAPLSLERLAWPLRQTKARKLLCQLERLKATISLALITQTS